MNEEEQLEYDQHQAELRTRPPLFGELNLVLSAAPVSFQASRIKKDTITTAIRDITQATKYFLTGDVQIEIEWLVHQRDRYESDASPDVDNIIKPLLDGICGPNGILIDDCQVQAISCHWIDWIREDQQVNIRVRFIPDDWSSKEGLVFMHMGKGLCMPVHRSSPAIGLLLEIEAFENMFVSRDKLLDLTGDDYKAKRVMSVQRVFHRTRLGSFEVVELETLKAEAKSRSLESDA